jgi:hypothetical protein
MKRAWLEELYRQWRAARGNRAMPRTRAFRRKWPDLLEAAGLHSAEAQHVALRDARKEHERGHVKLNGLKGRTYLVQTIELPLPAEPWLLAQFSQRQPGECHAASLREVSLAAAWPHPRFPQLWADWCAKLESVFRAGRNLRPLYWGSPESVKEMLGIVYRLTALLWRDGALVREISVEIGLHSKALERKRRGVESCLAQMFGRAMPLEALGIVLTDSRTDLAGIFTLHFPGGETQIFDELRSIYGLSLSDLERAERASTPAARILTIENSKTTLRRLASVNSDGDTLMAACSFPTRALLRLLELLPRELPVYHFGDTDPSGYLILSKLRSSSHRQVKPFLMQRRNAPQTVPLGEYDRAILPRLLADPLLADVAAELNVIRDSDCKGDFEQETLGLPDLDTWPFFTRNAPAF